jgi:hypothetical protein
MAGIFDMLSPTTIANFARGAWDGVSQNNPFFNELKKRAKITYDVGGDTLQGVVEAGRYQPTITAPGQDLSALFTPKVRHARWTAPWAELANATVVDRGMLRRNSGDQALVRLRDTELPALFRDLIVGTNGLGHQLLSMNANAYTGTGLPFYGLPTFLPGNGTGQTMAQAITAWDLEGFNPATGALTGSAPADGDREVAIGSSATYQNYLGLSMRPGALAGIDGLEADAWTPTLVNAHSSYFGTADRPDLNMLGILQYAVDSGSRFSNSDTTKRPTFGVMDRLYFSYLGQLIAAKQTIYVESGKKDTGTPTLGYGQYELMHAGLKWMWDENCPSASAFVVNANHIGLNVQPLYKDQENGSPLKVSGEDAGIMETAVNFDPLRRQYLVSATIPGQFVANPRYFVRVGAYSA